MIRLDPHYSPQGGQESSLSAAASPWFTPLVEPIEGQVQAALDRLGQAHRAPRAGLGAALTVHIAHTWGQRRWRAALKLATTAVEAVNARVHHGDHDDSDRAAWLGMDVSRVRAVWKGLLRHDEALLHRVLDRVLAHGPLGDGPIPESVLFMRGCAAAAVIAANVPDDVHARLDRLFTWMGLALEPTAPPEAWHGALAAVGLQPVPPSRAEAVEHVLLELDQLPHSSFSDALGTALQYLGERPEPPSVRAFEAWHAHTTPAPAPRLHPVPVAHDPVTRYGARWRSDLQGTLSDVVRSPSRSIDGALSLLQHQGGKRLRPLVVLAAAQAVGGDPARALVPAALIEWLHQASLVLDDIVDEATLRRGASTLHQATSEPFAIGVTAWILARIAVELRQLPPDVRSTMADAAQTLAEGQRSELHHTGDPELSLTGYYRIIEAKTARLFAASAAMGGTVGGGNPRQVAALFRYGVEAGLAFQIVDDVLDYTGALDLLGKRPGTDMRARKVTLPVLLLRERLDIRGRDRLATILFDASSDPNEADLDWMRLAMHRHDIVSDCIRRARTHRDRALDALSTLPRGEGRDVLMALANRFVERDR